MIETLGHYPECDDWRIGARRGVRACICEWLRACEARVRYDIAKSVDDGTARLEGHRIVLLDAALDAARDAVAALLSDEAPEYLAKWVWPYGPAQMKADALAAIDALKEEK